MPNVIIQQLFQLLYYSDVTKGHLTCSIQYLKALTPRAGPKTFHANPTLTVLN